MISWLEGRVADYYPFVGAYMIKSEMDSSWARIRRYRQNANGEIVRLVPVNSPAWMNEKGESIPKSKPLLEDWAFVLSVNGGVRKVKIPDFFMARGSGFVEERGHGVADVFLISGPYLSRRGLIWIGGSVLPKSNNGIYLSRGEQVKRISSENARSGKISPDGCRLAYTTTSVDLFGTITRPTLKVMNLCEGEK